MKKTILQSATIQDPICIEFDAFDCDEIVCFAEWQPHIYSLDEMISIYERLSKISISSFQFWKVRTSNS